MDFYLRTGLSGVDRFGGILLMVAQPFDQHSRFFEKDGYAWCENCHKNRFSPKCKRCRRPVTETGVVALGANWHAECFCCAVSLPSPTGPKEYEESEIWVLGLTRMAGVQRSD